MRSTEWVRELELLIEADKNFPAFLRGEVLPAGDERLAMAEICNDHKRLHRTAARLYKEAFADQPARADVPAGGWYYAACAAALAGCGQGEDVALSGAELARWRQQSLEWLRVDLAAHAKLIETGTAADGTVVRLRLQHWLRDPTLARLRDAEPLARLPEPEREGWCRLWADVAALLQRA